MKDGRYAGIGAGIIGVYIMWPTITRWASYISPFGTRAPEQGQTRHTVGLINSGTLCFINSDIQA